MSRAIVREDLPRQGIKIAVQVEPDLFAVWQPTTLEHVPETQELPEGAWLRMGDEDGRALYEALRAHYDGPGRLRTDEALRKDYDAERGRVDKLLDALVSVATV